jgi:formylglycine-generating enzyme required for sulfatase activity
MHGNVWEWTLSELTHDHKRLEAPHDPSAVDRPPPAVRRVVRGGSWWNDPQICRSAYRNWWHPTSRDDSLGFRLVRLPASCTAIDR